MLLSSCDSHSSWRYLRGGPLFLYEEAGVVGEQGMQLIAGRAGKGEQILVDEPVEESTSARRCGMHKRGNGISGQLVAAMGAEELEELLFAWAECLVGMVEHCAQPSATGGQFTDPIF